MIVHRMSDGRLGQYVPGYGFVPLIASAAISIVPSVLDFFKPPPPPAQLNLPAIAPEKDNTAVLVGAGIGTLLIIGGIAYLVLK
jgi:hypothetical protein